MLKPNSTESLPGNRAGAVSTSIQNASDAFFRVLVAFLESKQRVILFSILLLAVLLRVSNLNESLWYDEMWSTHVKLGDLVSLWNTIAYDFHPPFYSVLMFLWIRVFGDSELSVRLLPLLFGIGSIALTYLIALRFVGKNVALLVVWLVAVSPVHIWYSDEARQYSASLFFLLLSILAYYRLTASAPNRIWYLVYPISLLFAVLNHYFIAVYAVLISLLCLYKPNTTKRNVLGLNIAILGLLGLFVLLKSRIALATSAPYLRGFTLSELWGLYDWFLSGYSLSRPDERLLLLVAQMVGLVFFCLGAIWFVRQARVLRDLARLEVLLFLFALPLFLLGLNIVGFKNVYIERSAYVVLPFFFLVLAQGFAVTPRSLTATGILLTLVFNLLVLSAFFTRGDEWTVYKPKEDFRAAAMYLANDSADADDRIDVFTADQVLSLTYYDPYCIESSELALRQHDTRDTSRRLLGESSIFFRMISAEWAKHDDLLATRVANAKLVIHYPGVNGEPALSDTLPRDRQTVFYLVANSHWQEHSKTLAGDVVHDPRFQVLSRRTFKGIDIFKLQVAPQTAWEQK